MPHCTYLSQDYQNPPNLNNESSLNQSNLNNEASKSVMTSNTYCSATPSRKEKMLANKKESSYMNEKIVAHDKDINHRVNLVDQLLGKYKDKDCITNQFLGMILIEKDSAAYG